MKTKLKTNYDFDQATKLYTEGKSLLEVCQICKIPYATLRPYIKVNGLTRACNANRTEKLPDIIKLFAEGGCELLVAEYTNNHTPMDYRCSCGNISKIALKQFKRGERCRKCCGSEKLTQEYIENFFREQGCELLDTYQNCMAVMKYRCSCGEIGYVRWNDFKDGSRCKNCKTERSSPKMIESHWSKSGVYSPPITRVEQICKGCGKTYEVVKCREETSNYCSNNCNANSKRDPLAKEKKLFRVKIRACLKHYLNMFNLTKTAKTHDILGYTATEFRNYIKSHPNYPSKGKWSIDHIFPIKAFVDYGINDPKIINSLINLQPLPLQENLTKGDKYDRKEFESWLSEKWNINVVVL